MLYSFEMANICRIFKLEQYFFKPQVMIFTISNLVNAFSKIQTKITENNLFFKSIVFGNEKRR